MKDLAAEEAGKQLLEGIPEVTLKRVGSLVQDFRERRASGHLTLVLHYQEGEPRPSELGIHERGIGEHRRPVGTFGLSEEDL